MSKRRVAILAAALLVGGAGLASAAVPPCYPDPAGTRTLQVEGAVTDYGFKDRRVVVNWVRPTGCAGTAVWDFRSSPGASASTRCTRSDRAPAGVPAQSVAAEGARSIKVRFARRNADLPDRLDVFERATHRRVASWPLIDRPTRVALYGDLAVLSAAGRSALYVLRVSDGRIAKIGVTQPWDRPVIGPDGVVYQDDLMLPNDRDASGRTLPVGLRTVTLKLVPLASLRTALDSVRTRTSTSISDFAMDGPRVAFAVRDPEGACDTLRLWNVPWNVAGNITRKSGQTCLPTHAPGGIANVALAGTRSAWTTTYGHTTRVLAASSKACEEWVVTRPESAERVTGLAGDRRILVYALSPTAARMPTQSGVAVVSPSWRGLRIARVPGRVLGLSVHDRRIAVLDSRGDVLVAKPGGVPVARIHTGHASSIALRSNILVTLGDRGTLAVYRLSDGRRISTWTVARSASSLDVEFGIALVTAGRDVYALNLQTGKSALAYRAPATVKAELESPGAVVQFNVRGRGHLEFLPMSRIEAITR